MKSIGILGLGLIGGSLARAIKEKMPHCSVVSVQREDGDLLLAQSQGIVKLCDTLEEMLDGIDLLVIATPLSAILPMAKKLAQHQKPLLVIDVGSVKREIALAFEELSQGKVEFLSTHPMAGSEGRGFALSRADLFFNAPWIITPHANNKQESLKKIENWIVLLGAKPILMSADEHDADAALVSHVPYLIAHDFLDYVSQSSPSAMRMAGPGFHSFTRIAHDNPQLRGEIFEKNRDLISHHLEKWRKRWAKKPTEVPVSATVRMNDLALKKKKEGVSIFNFSAGDIVLPIHAVIQSEVSKRLSSEPACYAPAAGLMELRSLAASWMRDRYGASFTTEETVVTCGGKFALYALLTTLCQDGDEVLLPAPYWVSFLPMVQMSGASAAIVPASEEKGWKITPEDLEAKWNSNTKLLIFNNGCNPTGALYNPQEVLAILKWAKERDVFVVSDEVYSELVYDGAMYTSCASYPEFHAGVAVVQSCSKNFGMTGWRVGFAFGPKSVIDKIISLQGQSTTGTSTVSQWAAIGALKNAAQVSLSIRNTMQSRRDLFVSAFNRLFQTDLAAPPSAIYLFVRLKDMGIDDEDSQRFAERAMEFASVATVPGIAFGCEGYVRFAFSEDKAVDGLEALHQFCQKERL